MCNSSFGEWDLDVVLTHTDRLIIRPDVKKVFFFLVLSTPKHSENGATIVKGFWLPQAYYEIFRWRYCPPVDPINFQVGVLEAAVVMICGIVINKR